MTPCAARYAIRALLTVCLFLAPGVEPIMAQPAAPPPPARYRASVRYDLPSPRDQHVSHYDALVEQLKQLHFEFIPALDDLPETDREDPTKNAITGILPSASVRPLLRYPDVGAMLLMPLDYKLPANAAMPVPVRLELASGFGLQRQRALADQTLLLLGQLGFHDAVGYDHHGLSGQAFTRLVGTIPAGEVETLLKDLRGQPAGWLAPRFAFADLPLPLRGVCPVVVTEVVPGTEAVKELLAPPPRGNSNQDKIGGMLWALASQKDQQATQVRMEIILAYEPAEETSWAQALRKAAPGLLVEGRLGPVVTVVAQVGQSPALAALPLVSVVRLPRPARVAVDAAVQFETDNAAALRLTGVERLHQLGYRGKARGEPVRLAIIDTDFRGHEALVKSGKLPAGTHLVDLTTEGNPLLFPAPWPRNPPAIGHGTQCALAAVLAAPEVDLTLIRIDPAAPYQVRTAARYIAGDPIASENLRRRLDELARDQAALRQRRSVLRQERRFILNNFEDETGFERDYGILGPARAWVFSEREWHALRLAEYDRAALELYEREQRYLRLVKDLARLKGIQIVACPLVWNEGYPLGGASALSRAFDEAAPNAVLWFQAAGNTRGQSWAGPWEDRGGNGVLEFAPPQMTLPPGRWTSELNFLGWRPYEAAERPDLPEGTRVRITLQWREPHDPSLFFRPGETDLYLQPLATPHLMVLRQRDPQGKTIAADDFEVVARGSGLPQRLDNQPAASTYEQAVEFTAVKGARYALRVTRQLPTRWAIVLDPASGRPLLRQLQDLVPSGIRPLNTPTLPALERNWELQPRLFVDAAGGPAQGLGRPVFLDFPTDAGSIGVPADAHAVLAIGAADISGKAEPYSGTGPPANLGLLQRPNALAFDRLRVTFGGGGRAYGTSLAAPFASGTAATMLSAGAPSEYVRQLLEGQAGTYFHLPRRNSPSLQAR